MAAKPEIIDNDDSDLEVTYYPTSNLSKGISLAKIIELRNKKLSYAQIGKIVGCSKENVIQRIKPFQTSIDNLPSIKENRADLLATVSDTILNSLTEADIKKAPAGQRVMMYGILYDKERLERGQATQNIATLSADLEALRSAKIDHEKV